MRVADGLRALAFDEDEDMAESKTNLSSPPSILAAPKVLQTPMIIPPLYPLARTNIYLLLSPDAPKTIPKTVILRNEASTNPFEMHIPVEVLQEPGVTIHSLAAKRAMVELEEGKGWLSHARDHSGNLLKKNKTSYTKLTQKEAIRLGVQFQLTGKFTSSVAVESNTSDSLINTGAEIQHVKIAPATSSSNVLKRTGLRELAAINHAPASSSSASQPLYRTGGIHDYSTAHKTLASQASYPASSSPPLASQTQAHYSHFAMMAAPVSQPRTQQRFRGGGGWSGPIAHGGSGRDVRLCDNSYSYGTRTRGAPVNYEPEQTKSEPEEAIEYSDDEDMGYAAIWDDAEAEAEIDDSNPVDDSTDRYMAKSAGNIVGSASSSSIKGDSAEESKSEPQSDPVTDLIALQSFDGSWLSSPQLLHVLCLTHSAPKPDEEDKECTDTLWSTLLAIAFLEEKWQAEKETWEMVVEKAYRFVESAVGRSKSQVLNSWKAKACEVFRVA